MQDFRLLRAWQAACALSLAVYAATRRFPPDERFGLTAQPRRAVVSIQANIAEGCGRRSNRDFAQFIQVAIASACEAESHLQLSTGLGFLP